MLMNRRGFFDLIGKGMTVIGLAKLPVLPAPKVVEELVGPEVAPVAEIATSACSSAAWGSTAVFWIQTTGPTGPQGYTYDLDPFPRKPYIRHRDSEEDV
jgi:hypothetical protein